MTIASYYLPDVLVGFKAKHAAVKCEVLEGNTDLILGLLLDQRIELGLVEGPCRRREIQVPVEPRLYRVTVGRHDFG